MFGYVQIVVRGLRNGEKRGIKMLIVIVGDFGVGKDTVADMCIDLFQSNEAPSEQTAWK